MWLFTSTSGVFANSPSSTHSPSPPPTTQDASWAVRPAVLKGTIIHFSSIENLYDATAAPSIKTRSIRGNIWERIDSQGNISEFHGLYTSLDGKTFYQEIYENADKSITVFGRQFPNTPFIPGKSTANWCIFQSPTPPSDLTSTLQLVFVNNTAIKSDGFQKISGVITQTLPSTSPLAQVGPSVSYSSSTTVSIWSKSVAVASNITRTQEEEVDSQNRVIVAGVKDVDASGVTIYSNWFSFGSVYVYNSSLVPKAVFSSPQKMLTGGCTR